MQGNQVHKVGCQNSEKESEKVFVPTIKSPKEDQENIDMLHIYACMQQQLINQEAVNLKERSCDILVGFVEGKEREK